MKDPFPDTDTVVPSMVSEGTAELILVWQTLISIKHPDLMWLARVL